MPGGVLTQSFSNFVPSLRDVETCPPQTSDEGLTWWWF